MINIQTFLGAGRGILLAVSAGSRSSVILLGGSSDGFDGVPRVIVGDGGGRVPHRRVLGGRGGPHVGVPGGLLEAAEAPGAGPHPLQVVTPALEGVQRGHDVLDHVVLLRDLPLDLLPLNLPVLIVDGTKQPDKEDKFTSVDLQFLLPHL